MCHDARGRSFLQSKLHDFTWVYRPVDRAAKQFLEMHQAMTLVQLW
jgi:hypothetical protein